jgi:hypothetical protein
MLFRETVAVYCENHTGHTNTLCGRTAEFQHGKAAGTYSDHWTLCSVLKTWILQRMLQCCDNKTQLVARVCERRFSLWSLIILGWRSLLKSRAWNGFRKPTISKYQSIIIGKHAAVLMFVLSRVWWLGLHKDAAVKLHTAANIMFLDIIHRPVFI